MHIFRVNELDLDCRVISILVWRGVLTGGKSGDKRESCGTSTEKFIRVFFYLKSKSLSCKGFKLFYPLRKNFVICLLF
jgi:hypothetical protein